MAQEKNPAIKFLDATLIIAVTTGVFFVCGYTFHEGFYGVLHVPMRALGLSPQDILVFGSTSVFTLLITAGVCLVLIALIHALSPRLAKLKWVGWLFDNSDAVPVLYVLGVFLLYSAFVYFGLIESRGSAGRSAGQQFLMGDCLLVDVTYAKAEGSAPIQIGGCFIVSSSDMYWLKPVSSTGTLTERTVALPISSIVQVEVEGNLQAIRDKKAGRFKL